jgi:hypothetical protein
LNEPPFLIDGALVRAYAALPPRSRALADGIPLDNASAVAIIESLAGGGAFLLFCNDDWETLAAEQHGDVETARRVAQGQFPAIAWIDYRPLTEAEAEQVQTTREFLRDLERDFPGAV